MDRKIVFVFLLMIGVTISSPLSGDRKRRQNDGPVIVVDAGSRDNGRFPFGLGFDDDDDDDDGFFGSPGFGMGWGNSRFDNIFKRFEEMMKDMRRRFQEEVYGESDFGELPPNYHNTTSETKNVNGTLITVNQTIDKHTSNNSQSFFHVKVVQVQPKKTDKPVEETSTGRTPQVPAIVPETVPEEEKTENETASQPPEVAEKDKNPPVETNEP